MENLKNIRKNFDSIDSNATDASDKFLLFAYNLAYDTLLEGKILSKSEVIDTLEVFLKLNDEVKCNFLAYILNHYYNNSCEVLFEKYVLEEKYELCNLLNKVKLIKNLPETR